MYFKQKDSDPKLEVLRSRGKEEQKNNTYVGNESKWIVAN